MSEIFISYASEDRPKAEALAAHLAKQGWSAFWDRTITPGAKFREEIRKALDSAQCVIVLWSTASVSKDWVIDEATKGKTRGILLPALIEEVSIPLGFGQFH